MIFDASSIFLAVKSKKLTVLKDAKTSQLVRYELGNAVWKEVRIHKTVSCERALELLNLLGSVVDKIEIAEPDYAETLKTACRYNLTFYDAVYVQLAMENSDVLITEDKKLRNKVSGDLDVLSVADLD
mgnify:CR=1 FL=1